MHIEKKTFTGTISLKLQVITVFCALPRFFAGYLKHVNSSKLYLSLSLSPTERTTETNFWNLQFIPPSSSSCSHKEIIKIYKNIFEKTNLKVTAVVKCVRRQRQRQWQNKNMRPKIMISYFFVSFL